MKKAYSLGVVKEIAYDSTKQLNKLTCTSSASRRACSRWYLASMVVRFVRQRCDGEYMCVARSSCSR